MKEYSKFDHFLIKAKDIGLLSLLGSVFYFIATWYPIPAKVEANTTEIQRIKDWERTTDQRLAVIANDVQTMKEQQNEMRQDIKVLLQRTR